MSARRAPGWHRRRIGAFLGPAILIACVAVTGCTRMRSAALDPSPSGVYTLISVDGKTVPGEVEHQGVRMTVKSGALTFRRDGTCESLTVFSVAGHGDVRRQVKATYTREGAELTMRWEGAGTTTGRVDGDRFTMTNEGMVFAYRK